MPSPTSVCNLVFDSMFCTILVTELPPSSVKLIWSPIFNSVVNLVPEPTSTSAWSAGFSKPIAVTKSPVSVPSSKIIESSESAPVLSVPSNIILPEDTAGLTVVITPDNVLLSPKVESNETLEVYVGLPAIETPLVCPKSFCSKPLHPNESNCTVPVLEFVGAVIVSPPTNSPCISFNTIVV